MGDQRVCFLCNLSHHTAVSTEHLGGGKPNGGWCICHGEKKFQRRRRNWKRSLHSWLCFSLLTPFENNSFEKNSFAFLHFGKDLWIPGIQALGRGVNCFVEEAQCLYYCLPLPVCYPVKAITLKCHRFLAWGLSTHHTIPKCFFHISLCCYLALKFWRGWKTSWFFTHVWAGREGSSPTGTTVGRQSII